MNRRRLISAVIGACAPAGLPGSVALAAPEPAQAVLSRARHEAASQRKPILVLFHASW